MATAELKRRIEQHLEQEKELVIDPAIFAAFRERAERVSDVEVVLKRGRYRNELTQFRYDVWLHVEAVDVTGEEVFESGEYDSDTGEHSHDEHLKIYEIHPGLCGEF